jgi:hypothetical protein
LTILSLPRKRLQERRATVSIAWKRQALGESALLRGCPTDRPALNYTGAGRETGQERTLGK